VWFGLQSQRTAGSRFDKRVSRPPPRFFHAPGGFADFLFLATVLNYLDGSRAEDKIIGNRSKEGFGKIATLLLRMFQIFGGFGRRLMECRIT